MTRRVGAALALLLLLLAPVARASVEEFQGYDLARMEEDDENFLDHWLTRMPLAWEDEYRAAPNAFRTSQGCYTAAQWFVHYDFKARAQLGKRAWLDLAYQQVDDDAAAWDWMRFDFRFPTDHYGNFGFRFQPSRDKSRHDFAGMWDWGAPGGPFEVNAVFTLEDAFNSLWEFRQTRVGRQSEPYRAHPVEPALRLASHGRHHRVEASGKWLTPLRQEVLSPDLALLDTRTLWGSKADFLGVATAGPWDFEARFEAEQVRESNRDTLADGDARRFARRWQGEVALRHHWGGSWCSELRGAYQDRTQDWRPPPGVANMRALDRGLAFEVSGEPRPNLHLRLGYLHDRIGVALRGAVPEFTYGTRKESRAYVGLEARFGKVRVQGIEGIELDKEPYEVSFHHDKGFLQLQTTF